MFPSSCGESFFYFLLFIGAGMWAMKRIWGQASDTTKGVVSEVAKQGGISFLGWLFRK